MKKIVLACLMFSSSLVSLAGQKLVVIDAAHGGKDNGAEFGDFSEKDIVLNISKRIFKLSNSSDVKIVLIREGDEFTTLEQRVAKVNALKPDLLLSLHVNTSNDENQSGMELYISKENKNFAQSAIDARGIYISASKNKLVSGVNINSKNIYLIKNSNCPGVVIELGYLSNEKDRAYITSDSGQQQIAEMIYSYLTD